MALHMITHYRMRELLAVPFHSAAGMCIFMSLGLGLPWASKRGHLALGVGMLMHALSCYVKCVCRCSIRYSFVLHKIEDLLPKLVYASRHPECWVQHHHHPSHPHITRAPCFKHNNSCRVTSPWTREPPRSNMSADSI